MALLTIAALIIGAIGGGTYKVATTFAKDKSVSFEASPRVPLLAAIAQAIRPSIGIGAYDVGHHRRIDHLQSFDAAHVALLVDHRRRIAIRPHFRRPDRMKVGGAVVADEVSECGVRIDNRLRQSKDLLKIRNETRVMNYAPRDAHPLHHSANIFLLAEKV